MKFMKGVALALLVAVAAASVQGCNTMRGVGKDIQKGGQAVESVAS